MHTINSTLFDEQPLNLDFDDLLQAGRIPTCQQESAPESAETFESAATLCCGSLERELHQMDFQRWLI